MQTVGGRAPGGEGVKGGRGPRHQVRGPREGPGRWSGLWQQRPGGLTWPRVHSSSSGTRFNQNKGNRTKLYTNWVHWAVGKISSLLLEGMERHKCFVS